MQLLKVKGSRTYHMHYFLPLTILLTPLWSTCGNNKVIVSFLFDPLSTNNNTINCSVVTPTVIVNSSTKKAWEIGGTYHNWVRAYIYLRLMQIILKNSIVPTMSPKCKNVPVFRGKKNVARQKYKANKKIAEVTLQDVHIYIIWKDWRKQKGYYAGLLLRTQRILPLTCEWAAAMWPGWKRLTGSLGFNQVVLLYSPEYSWKDPRASKLKSVRTLPVRLTWEEGEIDHTNHVV